MVARVSHHRVEWNTRLPRFRGQSKRKEFTALNHTRGKYLFHHPLQPLFSLRFDPSVPRSNHNEKNISNLQFSTIFPNFRFQIFVRERDINSSTDTCHYRQQRITQLVKQTWSPIRIHTNLRRYSVFSIQGDPLLNISCATVASGAPISAPYYVQLLSVSLNSKPPCYDFGGAAG